MKMATWIKSTHGRIINLDLSFLIEEVSGNNSAYRAHFSNGESYHFTSAWTPEEFPQKIIPNTTGTYALIVEVLDETDIIADKATIIGWNITEGDYNRPIFGEPTSDHVVIAISRMDGKYDIPHEGSEYTQEQVIEKALEAYKQRKKLLEL